MRTDDGMYLMPESYAVPADSVNAEYLSPGSQQREVVGRCPFLWGQSLYILGKLLQEVIAYRFSSDFYIFSLYLLFFCRAFLPLVNWIH